MKDFFAKIKELVVKYWNMLPKEVKVAAFIAVSYGMADVITALEAVKVNNVALAIGLNIFLVFLKELKPRLDARKK
jgi:hypothetical protein